MSGAQQTSQSALSPGIGLLDEHPPFESEEDELPGPDDSYRSRAQEDLLVDDSDDDQSTVTERTSLVRRSSGRLGKQTSQPRPVRRRAISEAEEIWGELEDDRAALPRKQKRRWGDEEAMAAGEGTSLLGGKRRVTAWGQSRSRSKSWLSYMSTARGGVDNAVPEGGLQHQTSTPNFPLLGTRRPSLNLSLSLPRSLRRASVSALAGSKLQEAVGGWWPMRKWWNNDKHLRPGSGDPGPEEDGGGGGRS